MQAHEYFSWKQKVQMTIKINWAKKAIYGYFNRFRISDTNLIKLRTRASVLPKLEIRFGIRNLRLIHDKIHQNLTLR